MDQPTQLKTLDDLLAQAEHYAEFCMRSSGKMAPTLFVIGADGPLMVAASSMDGVEKKDAFVTGARLLCIAQAATSVVMAMEAWMKFAQQGEQIDMTEPPSEAFDRQEVVVLMGESKIGQKQRILPIIRSGNGRFFGFKDTVMPQTDRFEGRFSQILSPNTPTDEHRLIAKAMLELKGLNFDTPGHTVRLLRHRGKKSGR